MLVQREVDRVELTRGFGQLPVRQQIVLFEDLGVQRLPYVLRLGCVLRQEILRLARHEVPLGSQAILLHEGFFGGLGLGDLRLARLVRCMLQLLMEVLAGEERVVAGLRMLRGRRRHLNNLRLIRADEFQQIFDLVLRCAAAFDRGAETSLTTAQCVQKLNGVRGLLSLSQLLGRLLVCLGRNYDTGLRIRLDLASFNKVFVHPGESSVLAGARPCRPESRHDAAAIDRVLLLVEEEEFADASLWDVVIGVFSGLCHDRAT